MAADRFDTRQTGIWLFDVVRGSVTRSIIGNNYESTPVWAPDGRSFVFASARDTPPNLYLKRLDAAEADERLFITTLQSFPQSWSPDGQRIAHYTIDPKTGGDIWLLPVTGDRRPVPFIQTSFAEHHARISPDGRWMAYVSNESGRDEVYVTRFPRASGKWPVSSDGGNWPVWRRDGRELFYHAHDGQLMAVSVGAGPTSWLAGRRLYSHRKHWWVALGWARSTTSPLMVAFSSTCWSNAPRPRPRFCSTGPLVARVPKPPGSRNHFLIRLRQFSTAMIGEAPGFTAESTRKRWPSAEAAYWLRTVLP